MYRIQAYNLRTKNFTIHRCTQMHERTQIIEDLIATGDYTRASITWEWMPRGWWSW